jgi:hypothetical protein
LYGCKLGLYRVNYRRRIPVLPRKFIHIFEYRTSWLDKPAISAITLNWRKFFWLILTRDCQHFIFSNRVMSHDETSHVYFSWLYEQGNGYTHDPVTHGPLQFHLLALSYFMFGDNDFTARIPAAIFSVATIFFMWNFRRYLGRAGALITATLLLISPYILYYGRYARNEAFVALFGVITLWSMLSYLETGESRYLFWLTAATVLHFTSKETSFIYTAQALIFLAVYLVYRLIQRPWPEPEWRKYFIWTLIAALLLLSVSGVLFSTTPGAGSLTAEETVSPAVPGDQPGVASVSNRAVTIGRNYSCHLCAVGCGLYCARLFLEPAQRAFLCHVDRPGVWSCHAAPFPVKFLG